MIILLNIAATSISESQPKQSCKPKDDFIDTIWWKLQQSAYCYIIQPTITMFILPSGTCHSCCYKPLPTTMLWPLTAAHKCAGLVLYVKTFTSCSDLSVGHKTVAYHNTIFPQNAWNTRQGSLTSMSLKGEVCTSFMYVLQYSIYRFWSLIPHLHLRGTHTYISGGCRHWPPVYLLLGNICYSSQPRVFWCLKSLLFGDGSTQITQFYFFS